jgi:pyruvate formate lyase activating enzyme
MDIKGWIRTSLIDFPEHIASVIFTGGCNFRCPMCHNADLVLHPEDIPNISQDEILSYLQKRAGLIDGLVVSGGEPTLQNTLSLFLHEVKKLHMAVKLDTNGARPDVVMNLLHRDLVDFIALDIKAPPSKYALLTGNPKLDPNIVAESVHSMRASQVTVELRTTVVPHLLNREDISEIAQWLASMTLGMANRCSYVLQQFRGLHTLDPDLGVNKPYHSAYLFEMADIARQWLPNVKVRGV